MEDQNQAPVESAPEIQTEVVESAPVKETPDLAGQLETLQSQIAELRAAKEVAEQAAQEAAQSQLSESERLNNERDAWRAEVEEERARIRIEARAHALSKAGVLSKYHDFVPDVDPRTPDGAKAIEKWIAAHPETVVRTVEPTVNPVDQIGKKSSAVAEILTGKRRSTLVTAKSLSKMFNRG